MLGTSEHVVLQTFGQLNEDRREPPHADDEGPELWGIRIGARLQQRVPVNDVDLESGDTDPDLTGFGTRWVLLYFTPAEIADVDFSEEPSSSDNIILGKPSDISYSVWRIFLNPLL